MIFFGLFLSLFSNLLFKLFYKQKRLWEVLFSFLLSLLLLSVNTSVLTECTVICQVIPSNWQRIPPGRPARSWMSFSFIYSLLFAFLEIFLSFQIVTRVRNVKSGPMDILTVLLPRRSQPSAGSRLERPRWPSTLAVLAESSKSSFVSLPSSVWDSETSFPTDGWETGWTFRPIPFLEIFSSSGMISKSLV